MTIPILRFHEKSCYTCRYYRQNWADAHSNCLLLGRLLSISGDCWHDRARVCDGWKKRPETWDYWCDKNPFWEDKYISQASQERIRKRHGIRTKKRAKTS